TSENGDGAWSDTGEGTANKPPSATGATFRGGSFPLGATADFNETGPGSEGAFFEDADGDALTYSAAAQHPALMGVSLSGDAGEAQLAATLLNPGSSTLTYTASDAYGGSVSRTVTIMISAKATRSIAENSPGGTLVGNPVTGTPYNGVALSYSLTGNAKDSGLFVINSSSGQISVASGATLDYETDDSYRETETWQGEVTNKFYRGKVQYTVDGHAAAIDVSIILTDVEVEQPAPAVTIADASADEGDSITFTVTLDAAVSGGLTVTPSFTDGTAASTDYTANTTALSFTGTAGEQQTFTVATTEDEVVEADETFTVGLAVSGTSETITATDTATGTISNDDSAAVTIDDAVAFEGELLTFTVTLDNAVQDGLTVTPSLADVTATKGVDYAGDTEALTFAGTAGETQTFTVDAVMDDEEEGAETFTVSLTLSSAPPAVTATDTATGTIADEGVAVVTVDDASAAEGDSLTFTVKLNQAVKDGLTVTPSFTDVTATEGTDYTENTTALNFLGNAGETRTFTVATIEDSAVEANETFTVDLTVSAASVRVIATDTATGTITNDDVSAAVTIEDVSAAEGDDLTFTVTLDKAVKDGLKVTPSFTDVSATEGTDYTANTADLTFAGNAGETQSFTVSTTEDTAVEPNETFTVSLAVSGTTDTVTASDTATGTITNDDGSAAVTIEDASADEGEQITFTVTLDKAVAGGLTVTPSFTDGTATEGTDYTENTTGLTFTGTAGEQQTFTVSTTEDTDKEHHETFTVGLSVSETSASVTATDTATGTITDDDGALAAVTIADVSAEEGDDLTFTVTLDKAVSGGLTVTPSFTDGTATKGTDYTENTAALTFAGNANETQTFTVSTTEDTDDEADETFTVS
ncbi:MAG: hypothetical protein OXQ28_02225, partial [Acidobacteriota bacterium]|nr:hypothetical protein [Acidobacteriota bacterium]